MTEEQLKQAHNGLHLACSGLVAAANAYTAGSHPAVVERVGEMRAMQQRCAELIEELNGMLSQRHAKDGEQCLRY